MKHIKKRTGRIIAMLLALAMIVTSVPQYALTASAAEVTDETVAAEEQNETEAAAEAETEVKTAEVTEKEEAVEKTAETIVTEAETETEQVSADAADVEVETGIDKETENAVVEESGSDDASLAEGEPGEADSSSEPGSDPVNPDEPKEMVPVYVKVPYGTPEKKGYVNYIDGFEYAAPGLNNGEFIQYEDEGLFENDFLVENETRFKIDVPEGSDLSFRFHLKDRCTLQDVTYFDTVNGSSELTVGEDGIYKQQNIQADAQIEATATRYFNINIEAENAKVYLKPVGENEKEITELQLYTDTSQIIRVEPEEGYELANVTSNSSGLNLGKYGVYREYQLKINREINMKEPTTIFVNTINPSEKPKYKVTFDFERPEGVELYVNDTENWEESPWGTDKNEAEYTEGEPVEFLIKRPRDDNKGIFAEITENGETRPLIQSEYAGSEEEETECFWYTVCGEDGEGIFSDISIKISIVDIHTITFNVEHSEIEYVEYIPVWRSCSGGGYEELEFADGGEESNIRTAKVEIPAGYEAAFRPYQSNTRGSVTASVDGKELTWIMGDSDEDEGHFTYIPTGDATITLDIKPAEFVFDVDESISFSVYENQYNAETEEGEWKEITLPENKRIPYFYDKELQLRFTPEEGKRYAASATWYDGAYSPEEPYDLPDMDEETGMYICGIEAGYYTSFTLKSYETIPITFAKDVPENCGLEIRKFEYQYDEYDNGYWESSAWEWKNAEENKYTAVVDKDEELFFGVHYDESSYKLSDVSSITGEETVSLELYDICTIFTDKYDPETAKKWIIYKLTPTAETTVSIKAAELDRYTVTVIKGESVKTYNAEFYDNSTYDNADEITDASKVFEGIKENSTLTIGYIASVHDEEYNEEGEAPVYIRTVEYDAGDGVRHKVSANYSPYDVNGINYCIKVTGNLTVYVDATPVEDYEVTFADLTDRYDVEIWETGYDETDENAVSYTLTGSGNKVTLKNNKEYRFHILPKDGYGIESVVSTDADGKETVLEEVYNEDDEEENRYYLIEYGNAGNITIKPNMKDAYTLSFEIESSYLRAYSVDDHARIENKKTAVPKEDSYSFYFKDSSDEYDEQRYDVAVKENDSFTLRKDYRRIYDLEYDDYREYVVYTVEAKQGAAQLSKTATIAVTQKETKTVTLDYPNQVRYIGISYYSGNQENSYRIINNAATVRGSMNVLEVTPVSGYDVTVTMTGSSGTETLTLYRIQDGSFDYFLGEITEDKTIKITAQRTTSTPKYRRVSFCGNNVFIKDPEYKTPYDKGGYSDDWDNKYEEGGSIYYVLRGSSISFIAEPYYGYKIQSVTVKDEKITPDENGVYTFKPMIDGEENSTLIVVRTEKSDTPDIPDIPDEPEKTSTVTFTYPAEVSVTVDGYTLQNNKISVETGSQISFKAAVTDESYEIKSVTADAAAVSYNEATGKYSVTVTADMQITIAADKKPIAKKYTVSFEYPQNVSVTADGLANNQITDVAEGTVLSFKAAVTDENYEIKSVTANGTRILYDAATKTYSVPITADTKIVITSERKVNKYTVSFNYPQIVSVTADRLENNQVKDVAEGTEFTFKAAVTDENYEIKTVTANGTELSYNAAAGTYSVTVTADTIIIITAAQKATAEKKDPTEIKVQGVSGNGQLNLSAQSRRYSIALTPSDADGSVLGVKVNPENSVIKASITSETRGSRIIYYLSLEKPQASVGDTAEITIYNTKTGEAVSGGTFKVITRAPAVEEPDTSGLKVIFEGYDETETPSYTYTGSAVTPELEVTYNGEYLEQGTDYTIKYANNINASTNGKPAKLTITGKGSLAGKHDYTFKITPKDISDTYDVKAGSVKVVKGSKATPVLVYNGMVLGKKDFDNPDAAKKFSTDDTITLKGIGNYTGTREVKVEAVDKGQLNKISIKLDNAKNKNLAYDGTEKYPAFQVFDAKKTDITNKENTAYIVVYPENVISAGTVKFTVVGIGDYTGTVTKSYKIKPSAKAADDIRVSDPSSAGYTFVSTGVTEYEPDVRLKDGTWLEKGRDYTLAYSNNKKAGTAKCKINFIGNYKGIKAITKEFKINKFNIADFYEDNIIVADLTSGGKQGAYKSVPYIIDNEANALIKSSEFKFTYYVDEAMTKEMKEKLASGRIWVKIEPKNAAKGNYTGTRTVSYTIRESGKDLSKAKITFEPNKPAYTGGEVTPECRVDGTPIKNDPKYQVRYLSNINKGKATVIITGAEGSDYVGSKTATFTIAASDIK